MESVGAKPPPPGEGPETEPSAGHKAERRAASARRRLRRGRFLAFDLRVALAMLTILPLPIDHAAAGVRAARAAWAFPIVGWLIGAAVGGVYVGLGAVGVAAGPAAAAALGVSLLLTGALHEDGLADMADGVGARVSDKARALDIMKDSRVGAFGAVAIGFSLLARWAAIAAMPPIWAVFALGAAGALSRGAMTCVMASLAPARRRGLSARAGRAPVVAAVAAAVLALLLAYPCQLIGGVAALAAAAAALAVALIARSRLGGQTGDVLGAVQQAAEIVALIALSAGHIG